MVEIISNGAVYSAIKVQNIVIEKYVGIDPRY